MKKENIEKRRNRDKSGNLHHHIKRQAGQQDKTTKYDKQHGGDVHSAGLAFEQHPGKQNRKHDFNVGKQVCLC